MKPTTLSLTEQMAASTLRFAHAMPFLWFVLAWMNIVYAVLDIINGLYYVAGLEVWIALLNFSILGLIKHRHRMQSP